MGHVAVRPIKIRRYDADAGCDVLRVIGYRAYDDDVQVGKLHETYRNAVIAATNYARERRNERAGDAA